MVEQIKTMYSWNDIMILCKKIVDSVRKKEYPFTCILTIPRGGLVPARIISELLDIKKIVFSVADVKNSDFTLIVDDISDSGKTLVKLVSDYQTTKGLSYKVATVFVRDGTHYEPDFFGERLNHDKWIEFPWEAKALSMTPTCPKQAMFFGCVERKDIGSAPCPSDKLCVNKAHTIETKVCRRCGGQKWFVDPAGGRGEECEACDGTGVQVVKVPIPIDIDEVSDFVAKHPESAKDGQ